MTKQINRRDVLAAAGGALAASSMIWTAGQARGSVPPSLGAIPALDGRIPVAFIMGEGATMIDFAGPWEVFQDAEVADVPGFYLYTVSDGRAAIHTTGSSSAGRLHGLRVLPDFTFADAPQPKVIIMGAQGQHTPAKLDWIRRASVKADYVCSNCTGVFLLAKAGLLDGLSATTHHDFFDAFEKQFPRVKLVRDTRYVDNGKFITSGGLTSGIDGALHVVERIYGRKVAETVVAYLEYSGAGWLTRARS